MIFFTLQVEPNNENTAAAAASVPPVPSAPAGLHYASRDSSPENQRLLSDGSELQSDTTLVSGRGRTAQDGDGEEGEDRVIVTFYWDHVIPFSESCDLMSSC